jgi:hypothetical protein
MTFTAEALQPLSDARRGRKMFGCSTSNSGGAFSGLIGSHSGPPHPSPLPTGEREKEDAIRRVAGCELAKPLTRNLQLPNSQINPNRIPCPQLIQTGRLSQILFKEAQRIGWGSTPITVYIAALSAWT